MNVIGRWSFRVFLFLLALIFTGTSAVFVLAQDGPVAMVVFVVILWGAECFVYELVRLK